MMMNRLLQNVQLEEPDSDGGNARNTLIMLHVHTIMSLSQVQLFTDVRSPTGEPLNRMGMAPDNEGSNRVRCTEGGP